MPDLHEDRPQTEQAPTPVLTPEQRQYYLDQYCMAPDADYCFHGDVECLRLGIDLPCAAPFMQLNLNKLVDDNLYSAQQVTSLYEYWRLTASCEEKAIIDLQALLGLADYERLLVAATVDAIATQTSPLFIPTPDDDLDLSDLRNAVQHFLSEYATGMAERMGLIYERWEASRSQFTPLEIIHKASEWQRLQRAPRTNPHRGTSEHAGLRVAGEVPGWVFRSERQRLSRARRAIKRGIRTFQKLFGQDNRLTAFLSGHQITIEGQYFDYVITRTASVIDHTMNADRRHHVPYSLKLYSKASVYLAEVCVYFVDTPVIDQLIGLMTYVRHGCEDEVLKKANYFSRSEDYYTDTTLQELGLTSPVTGTDPMVQQGGLSPTEPSQRRGEALERFVQAGAAVDDLRRRLLPEVSTFVRGHIQVPERVLDISREHYLAFDELVGTYRAGALDPDTPLLLQL